MSFLTGRPGGRFPGRRFSFLRLFGSLLATVLVVGAGTAAVASTTFWTPGVKGAPLADRWFAGYYDVTLDTGAQLASANLDDMPGGVVLSFVVASAADSCTPSWGTAYSLDAAATALQLDRRVERIRRAGEPVVVSFGGASNTDLALACSSAGELSAAYRTVLDRYGADTVDLDVEGENLADTAAGARRAAALAQLQSERAAAHDPLVVWLTLPVATDGLTAPGLAEVRQLLAAGVKLAGVNVMTMDYGADLGGQTMGDAAISALRATAGQLTRLHREKLLVLPKGGVWAMLGATPMIGRNDTAGEVFTLDDARTLNSFARQQGLARLSMWSVNRDLTCGSNYPYPTIVSDRCSGIDQLGEHFGDLLADRFEAPASVLPASAAKKVADDPATSPYPIWSSVAYYSAGVTVVWDGGVYISKWWTQDGPRPDDPTVATASSPWTYLGPVLPSDTPFALPTLPKGTYPQWSSKTLYQEGAHVMFDGVGYTARWASQGQRPDRGVLDHDYSPWTLIDGAGAE